MANTFAPFGFRQFGTLEGNAPTYGLTRRVIASSDTQTYFTGDVVALSTGQGAGFGFLTQPASGLNTGVPIIGIFAGCEFFSPAVGRVVWSSFFPGNLGTSSSPCNAYVIEGEDNLFLVQTTTTAQIGTSNIGMNFGFTTGQTGSSQTGGNTTTGISNIALLSSSPAVGGTTNSSFAFRLVDTSSSWAPPGTNGTDGTSAGSIVLVSFNNSARRATAGISS